jgi:uncharacterized repeat protein (TIGR04076 family)
MYKVKCQLMKFEGDEDTFPCHFNYKIGDEIYYDGVKLTGKICPHLLLPMIPVVYGVHVLGHKYSENVPFRYRSHDMRDPSMAKYDGVGFRPVKNVSEAAREKTTAVLPATSRTEKPRGAHFCCSDSRTLAHFLCTPVDLSDSEFCLPFYRRAIAVLQKTEAEPGIETKAILERFTEFEREEISPVLTPVFLDVLLDALADMEYVKILDGKVNPTGKEPPSRPKIG